ncbi:hypothetical protein MKX01_021268 [Papaver californicum]|nr:hypothetical protein MKX01_021268 [Papaver californicum]
MEEVVKKLQEDVRELSLGTRVERLDSPPSPFSFLRDYFISLLMAKPMRWFHLPLLPVPPPLHCHLSVSAHTQPMPFPEALRLISSGSSDPFVAYAQEQNDCFSSEYSSLSSDVETHATEALGCHPEAVNLWIGNHLSTTSFHKDHYENLYAVITGEKHFLLLPPTDVHRLYVHNYPAARYSLSQDTGVLTLQLEEPRRLVPWCSVNPYPPAAIKDQEVSKFPLYFNGPKPSECTVKAGEILYLPSMWFHHVKQSPDNRGRTIAINYLYDMQFDIKYAYFNMWQSIRLSLSSNKLAVLEKNCDDSATTNE